MEYALSTVLSQDEDTKSKAFTHTQWNYEVYNQELLATMVPFLGDFRKQDLDGSCKCQKSQKEEENYHQAHC